MRIVLLVLFTALPRILAAEQSSWPRFHGPQGQGAVAQGQIPSRWTDDDYAWRHVLESPDVGSPIILGDRVYYLTSRTEPDEIALEALDLATGKLAWSAGYPHSKHPIHRRNTLASSTPAADAEGIVFAYAEPEHTYLKCLDHEGREIWSRDFGRWQAQHGFGTSPTIVGALVVLLNSQQADQLDPGEVPGESRLIAVDRSNGATVWQSPLATTRTCYGVPATFRDADGDLQLVGANTGNGIFGVDASTGKMLWNLKVFDQRCCSTPLVVGNLAIATCGSGGGGNELVAVRIPSTPDSQPQEMYRIGRAAPYVPTPALKAPWLFTVDDRGIASCVAADSGEVHWSQRIGGNFGASPIIVGDKLLLIDLAGQATILRAGPEFEKLGEVDLGGPVGATPAFAGGRLILRVGREIRCLETSR